MGMCFVEENRLGLAETARKAEAETNWEGELMTEEEKRLTEQVSILRGILSPFVGSVAEKGEMTL